MCGGNWWIFTMLFNYCDGLGRFFRFVSIYACTAVFLCCCRFSLNKDLYIKFNQLVEENSRMIINLPTKRDIRVTNMSKSFTYKMAAETSWHRQGTILRHCHPTYTLMVANGCIATCCLLWIALSISTRTCVLSPKSGPSPGVFRFRTPSVMHEFVAPHPKRHVVGSAAVAGLANVTNRQSQTDTQRDHETSATVSRILVLCMLCGVVKKVKVAHTRLPSVGSRSWSPFLAISLQVTWVI